MPPVVFMMIADVTDIIDVATVVSDKLIEAMILRMVIVRVLRIALMPLANQARGVTDFFQWLRERGLGRAAVLCGVRDDRSPGESQLRSRHAVDSDLSAIRRGLASKPFPTNGNRLAAFLPLQADRSRES